MVVSRPQERLSFRPLGSVLDEMSDVDRVLDELLTDALAGRAYFKVYSQFKMYNDPTLNPYLYGRK